MASTEEALYALEADVADARYQEMYLQKSGEIFRLGVIDGQWYIVAPRKTYEGENIRDVFQKASKDHLGIMLWINEFKEIE